MHTPTATCAPILWGLALAMISLTGCGNPTGSVSGNVTFQGQPLPAGKITFFCDGGTKPVVARDISAGSYTMPDMPAGNARVTIATFEVKQDAVVSPVQSPKPTDVPAGPAGPYVKIPDKYRMPDTSGLTHTITAGKQTKDWPLLP